MKTRTLQTISDEIARHRAEHGHEGYGGGSYLALLMARSGTIAVALLHNNTSALRNEVLRLIVLVVDWYERLDEALEQHPGNYTQ